MQPTTSNNDLRTVFPYHVHNQADFDNSFINGRDPLFAWAFPGHFLGISLYLRGHFEDEFHFLSIYKSSS